MRALLRPFVGGVLALLLVVSASPAQAFNGPVRAEEPTTVTAEDEFNDETGAETGTEGETGEDEAPVEEPVTDEPTTDEPTAEDPGDEAPAEGPATDDEATDDASEEAVEEEDSDAAEEVDPALAAATVTEAPNAITVTGSLLTVPDEAAAQLYDGSDEANHDHAEEGSAVAGAALIATDAGPVIAVDPTTLSGAGDAFSGTVTLTDEAKAAVDAALVESAALAEAESVEPAEAEAVEPTALTEAETLEIALEAASEAGQQLPVTGVLSEELVAETDAQTTKAHSIDAIFYEGGRSHTSAQLTSIINVAGNFWKGQSKSTINGIKLNGSVKRVAAKDRTPEQRCDYVNLWAHAAKKFGRTVAQYRAGSNDGRHLVVFVDEGCGSAAGWGSLGTYHRGGVVWVDTGIFSKSQPASMFASTLAHEIGHNLGLGHGQARSCSGSIVDSKSVVKYGSWRPSNSNCYDVEYGDKWNVMGSGYINDGNKPSALSVTQKDNLGLLSSSEIKKLAWNGTRTQTVTLSNAGGSTGVRAIKVTSPASGATFYVEYRSGAGQDSGRFWANGQQWDAPSFSGKVSTGVQVLKSHHMTNSSYTNHESVVIPQKRSGVRYQTLKAGQSMRPWGDYVSVKVVSTSSSSAKVQIIFTPYKDVAYTHTHYNGITWMYNKKYAAHVAKYNPANSMTRQAMAVMLFRMKAPSNYKVGTKKLPFTDIPKSHKNYKHIYWMWEKGYAATATKFNPTSKVTRGSMATFLYRLEKSKYKAKTKSNPYSDIKGNTHYKPIMWLYSNGLAAKANKYNPNGPVTRQAMATFLYRVYG